MFSLQSYGDKINDIQDRYHKGLTRESDLDLLKSLISEMRGFDCSLESTDVQAGYYYYIGNAWSQLLQMTGRPEIPLGNNEAIEQQILNYRKAMMLAQKADNSFLLCQIYINLANLFSHLGRSLEAQEYYEKCLEINPSFMMAVGNRGFHLFHAARLASNNIEQYLLFRTAWGHLIKASSSAQVYTSARNDFARLATIIEGLYKPEYLKSALDLPQMHYAEGEKERAYNAWCAANGLFLNILNGIFRNVEASSCDSLCLSKDSSENEKQIFNNLKQEYATARYFVYESLDYLQDNYADRCTHIIEYNTDIEYSVRIEKLKAAFRMFYSMFDKIAYILNDVLNLDVEPHKVSFRTIWYDKTRSLREVLKDKRSWPLVGLFWIGKDLYDPTFKDCIEPDAEHLSDIRNHIEHKALQIIYDYSGESNPNDFIYKVDYDYFIEALFKLMRLTRSALFNLAKVIDWESHNN